MSAGSFIYSSICPQSSEIDIDYYIRYMQLYCRLRTCHCQSSAMAERPAAIDGPPGPGRARARCMLASATPTPTPRHMGAILTSHVSHQFRLSSLPSTF